MIGPGGNRMKEILQVVDGARLLLERGRSHAAWRLLVGLSDALREETVPRGPGGAAGRRFGRARLPEQEAGR